MAKISATLLLGVALVLFHGAAAMGAYAIKLKNGHEFITSRYWQDGRQLLFEVYGGVFGVDKALITTIEASDKPITLLSTVTEAPEAKPQPAPVKGEREGIQPAASPEAKAQVKRTGDPIFKEFDALKERFKGLDGMLTSELQEFSTDLTNLKRKIQASGKPNDYLREFTALFEMGDALEKALQTRR